MGKVVRAFSLDKSVSEDLDFYTRVPGLSKPMNKSKYVNEALQFYMGKNIKKMIEENRTLKENLTGGLVAKDVEIQGLKHQLDALENAMARPDCRCLWCRLKKRLQKSQAEQ
jgi:hypothetical protein